ncbi:OmpA family protein [Vibrio sp. HA2012]|uniref:OmpA family protein n=1 Tax=Vibrio sp. HA2012 TaxID=1971595 RepID=UPI000C2CB31E|nr:OmpA family protein [Vibrio sp. HA2012]PJC86088.1 OmpA family protein [Vibrio sp. HA2012]
MIINKKAVPLLALVVVSSLAGSVYAGEQEDSQVDRALHYYCAQKDVSTEENVVIGQSKQVNLLSGPFYLLESSSAYRATIELVSQEAVSAGVGSECAEYLLTKAKVQGYAQGKLLARVFFDFDRHNLSKDSRYILQSVADRLKQNASELILEGHTDSIGSVGYNFSLGLKRSAAVKLYLEEKGVSPDDLVAVSRGEEQPIASNKTAEGRSQNRRVDMISE